MDRNEQRRARDQLLVVHVARVDPGWIAAHAARIARRRDAHAAEEGVQGDVHPRGEAGDHATTVEGDDARPVRAVTIAWQEPSAAVVAVREREIDAEDA